MHLESLTYSPPLWKYIFEHHLGLDSFLPFICSLTSSRDISSFFLHFVSTFNLRFLTSPSTFLLLLKRKLPFGLSLYPFIYRAWEIGINLKYNEDALYHIYCGIYENRRITFNHHWDDLCDNREKRTFLVRRNFFR